MQCNNFLSKILHRTLDHLYQIFILPDQTHVYGEVLSKAPDQFKMFEEEQAKVTLIHLI